MPAVTIEPIDATDQTLASHAGAAFFCRELPKLRAEQPPSRLLVAGCGSGHEAAAIGQTLDTEVDAFDVEDFVPNALRDRQGLRFQIASVVDLPFADATFDAVFYHHVIEHVDDPAGSLRELSRVLADDGVIFVGTPNRNRLISSIGAHTQSEWEPTVWNKFMDNVTDVWDRCRGRFRNEYGAHAGFTRRELDAMLAPLFSRRTWVTREYLEFKYRRHRLLPLVQLAARRPWAEVLAPSIYVFASKTVDSGQ